MALITGLTAVSACSLVIASQEKGDRPCTSQNACASGFVCVAGFCKADESAAGCQRGQDCPSGVCLTDGTCSPSCSDRVLDGEESDVDCGGAGGCPACETGAHCLIGDDCASGQCAAGVCGNVGCGDRVQDGDETDIDCGGSCNGCPQGRQCGTASDCESGLCVSSRCATSSESTCTDGIQNGTETGIDCGGSCKACEDAPCAANGDCASNRCVAALCTAAAAVVVPVTEDAFVVQASPDSTFGGLPDVVVSDWQGFVDRIYLKFANVSLPAGARRASLRFHVFTFNAPAAPAPPTTLNLRLRPDGTWSEGTLTWNNQPALAGVLTTLVMLQSQGAWGSVDIPASAIGSGGTLTLVFEHDAGPEYSWSFDSREAPAGTGAVLVVWP